MAREPVPTDPAARAAGAKAAEDAAEQTATKTAHAVFSVGGRRTGQTTTAGTRPPTAAARTAARVLVIVSDGHFREDPRREGQQRLDRLRASGCGLLWLSTDPTDTPLDGVTVHQLSDPAATIRTIGHAATTALRATQ